MITSNIMIQDSNPKELEVLNYLNQNSDATQRDLSEHVGISLGAINLLLKKLVKKGLIKIEKLQPNSVRYFLTPSGIADKIERTYRYIVRTYNEIELLRNKIVSEANYIAQMYKTSEIRFFGYEDDFYEMVVDLINLNCFNSKITVFHDLDKLKKIDDSVPIIVWQDKVDKILKKEDYNTINILKKIVV